jgi:hypothetical protein
MCLGGGTGAVILKYFKKNTHIVKSLLKVSEKQLLFFYLCCAKLVLWSKRFKILVLKLCFFSQTFAKFETVAFFPYFFFKVCTIFLRTVFDIWGTRK